MKEMLKRFGMVLLMLLYIGGFICILVAAFGFFKALIPVVAALAVLGFSVPTAVKLGKELLIGDITFE